MSISDNGHAHALGSVGTLGGQIVLPVGRIRTLRPSKLWLEGDPAEHAALVWDASDADLCPPDGTPDECLHDFIRCADGKYPERVLAFARTYGVLDICAHGSSLPWLPPGPCESCQAELERGVTLRREPLAGWRMQAFQLHAFLMSESYRQRGQQPAGPDHWLRSWLWDWQTLLEWGLEMTQEQMQTLASIAPEMLALGHEIWFPALWSQHIAKIGGLYLSPGIDRSQATGDLGPVFHIHVEGLFPLLALQYSAVVSSDRGIYVCGRCRFPFWPNVNRNKPWKSGRDGYCSDECHLARRAAKARAKYADDHPVPRRRRKDATDR